MNINKYTSLRETIVALQKRAYMRAFHFKNQKLYCYQTNKVYQPEDVQIVEYHRFSDTALVSDTILIVAVECLDREKGYVISAESTAENVKLLEFMDKAKIKPRKNRKLVQVGKSS